MDPEAWVIFNISGKDAVSYFNRKCSQLISAQTLQEGCISHFLTPKGKVSHTFGMMQDPDGQIYAELHASIYNSFKEDVEKYIFTEDLSIGAPIPYQWSTQSTPGSIASVMFKPLSLFFSFTSPQEKSDSETLTKKRVLAKIPIFPLDYDSTFSALDSDVIQGIHFDKGCYPGQEVVAKSLHIGNPPFALLWFHAPLKQIEEFSTIYRGKITSTYNIDGETVGFIRLKRKLNISQLSQEHQIQIEPHAFSQPLPST